MAPWDLEAIAQALDGVVRHRKPHVYDVAITHRQLGIRLKLDMAPEHDALRLWCDRNDEGRLVLLGRIDLFEIGEVAIDPEQGIVRFRTRDTCPSELEITSDATYLLSVGGSPRSAVAPATVVPARETESEDELIRLVGRLARPHYSESSGKPFFTAGLAEHPDGAMAPVWHNLKAFGGVAREARHLERGDWVRLTGKPHQERYRKGGVEQTKPVILLVHIEAVDQN
jgi:hypothetical protein